MNQIVDGNRIYNKSVKEYVKDVILPFANQRGVDIPSYHEISDVEPIKCRIEHGIWRVDCPDCHDCGVLYLNFMLFMCITCFNSNVNGLWRRCAVPIERNIIETLLTVRPLTNRNWYPDEPIGNLIKENLEHGVPII